LAPLPDLCQLRDRHQAILLIDEAHGTGILGSHGSGLAEHQQVAGDIDVTISTASKALGSLGGIVTARPEVIDTLINTARPFIYTTAAPPTAVAAIEAALDIVRDEPQRRIALAALSTRLRTGLRKIGWDIPDDPTPIIPLIIGDAAAAIAISTRLTEAGFLIPAIRPPTVAPGTSRLRITLRCDVTVDDIDRLIIAVGPFNGPLRSPSATL
jgi:8-amino-7-oxononanoate synthase